MIPREVRREAVIEPGTPLDVRWRDGVIEIAPRPLAVTFERKGHLLVARSKSSEAPPQTAEKDEADVAPPR